MREKLDHVKEVAAGFMQEIKDLISSIDSNKQEIAGMAAEKKALEASIAQTKDDAAARQQRYQDQIDAMAEQVKKATTDQRESLKKLNKDFSKQQTELTIQLRDQKEAFDLYAKGVKDELANLKAEVAEKQKLLAKLKQQVDTEMGAL